MRFRRPAVVAAALVAVLLAALPAAAYTIYLKDGTKIIAKQKYEVVDGRAYFTLQNGTRTFIAADELDVPRTEKANVANLGSAVVIEEGEARDVPTPAEPEPERSLRDLIRERRDEEPARREPAQRPTPQQETTPAPAVATTIAGYPDLASLPRQPFTGRELGAELKSFFRNQGVDEAQIYQGTEAALPMAEVTVSSEATVFRALAVAASALLHLQDRGRSTDHLELLLTTPSGQRAGQFNLTPSLARDLLSKKVDPATFYIQNVQF